MSVSQLISAERPRRRPSYAAQHVFQNLFYLFLLAAEAPRNLLFTTRRGLSIIFHDLKPIWKNIVALLAPSLSAVEIQFSRDTHTHVYICI